MDIIKETTNEYVEMMNKHQKGIFWCMLAVGELPEDVDFTDGCI